MTADHETTRIVRSWLEEGVTALPDRVLDAVLDQIPATPQRRARWPARRLPDMNNALKLTVAATAIIAISIVGVALVGGRPDQGVGSPIASAEPTPAPSQNTSPSPLPSAGAGPQDIDVVAGPWRITGTLPAGFTRFDNFAFWDETADPPGGHGIAFWRVRNAYRDPCASDTTAFDPPIGSSVDDFVDALAAREGGLAGPVEPITVAGFEGKRVTIQVPEDMSVSSCDGRQYRSWVEPDGGHRFHQGPGQVDELLVIGDPTGRERLVIDLFSFPATPPDHLDEIRAIVDSLDITLVAPSTPAP